MMAMSQGALMGIDVGTSGVKVVVIDRGGRTLGQATVGYEVSQPQPLFAEQNPEDWWEATCAAIRLALGRSGLGGEDIAAVGLTGQMHSLVTLDASGAVVRPAILWSDQRTEAECAEIHERVGFEQTIEWVANPALTNFTATKLLWVRQHEPDLYARIRHVLLPKDYIRYRLTGEFATDVSDASGTLWFDVKHRRWSDEMVAALEVPKDWLPRVYESPEVSGRVSEGAAAKTGLRAGTPVAAGGGDQAAGAVGNGIVRKGAVSSTIGTSGVVFAHADEIVRDEKGRLHTFCHAVPGKWHVMAVTQSAGGSLQWFRNQFADAERAVAAQTGRDVYDLLGEEARRVPAGSEGLVFLPYLMGERTPHLDPQAKGVFFGITARHERAHFVRAIMEGVAFSLRDGLQLMEDLELPVEEIRVSGGGAKSDVWREIQAGVFGRPVVAIAANEGPAFGAAILASVAANVFSDVLTAVDAWVSVESTTEPVAADRAAYEEAYRVYRALYPALKSIYRANG
ncbi:xylulokinase [Alicyclobacillus vulcanalis]|uniref:Xylulose kinase n=1 Tax=Alicyclobacillus vulcanalis TaxID=252246 RepID=A0A1N7PCN8_9BACL|nr:xylulokinase [Alicyclobacillus vulcanalis]SIT08372.1 xylulokinase [Alicyclobacillus vulcanalis]